MGSVFGLVRFLLPVCRLSWFLYTLNIYAHFSSHFLSNYWWQRSDSWSQTSYRYPISWEAFFDLSDSYFLFAEEQGYHRWALAHSSSCFNSHSWTDIINLTVFRPWWWYDNTLSLHKDDMLSFAILKGPLSNLNLEIILGVDRQCVMVLHPGVKIQDFNSHSWTDIPI